MRALTSLALILAAGLLAACGDSAGPGQAGVSLSIASRAAAPAPAAAAGAAASYVLSDGQNELVLTTAEIVLREIELEPVDVADCDVEPEPAGCQKFESGPILLDLPLIAGTARLVTVAVPAGSYRELEFDIHKVSNGDPEDAAFRLAHPDMVEKSIRIQGTYNGVGFTYESDLMDAQEYRFTVPLVIDDASTSTNLTVHFDLDAWFRDASGTLVDPATANKGAANENLVTDNIRRSIRAFEDRDRDGREG